MSAAAAVVGIGLRVVVLVLAVVFAVETSKGDALLTKIGKFLGLVVSVLPIVGVIFYVVAKGRKSGFGERCGGMAIAGVVLYTVTRALR